jgi:hypothetical protein
MPKVSVGLLAAVLAAGLIAAGCGGDDDEDTTAATTTEAGATGATGAAGGEPLSKSEFVEQADRICRQGDQEIQQAAQELGPGRPSDQEVEQFATETVVPNIQEQIDGIRQLTPPKGDEEEVNAIVDAAQEGVDMLEADPSLLLQGPDAGGAFAEANRLAQQYGLEACGG